MQENQDDDLNAEFREAAEEGRLERLKVLIDEGADIHSRDEKKRTALHYAVFGQRLDCLDFLVQQGVNIHLKSKYGRTALHHAAWQGSLDIVKYLVKHGSHIDGQTKNGMTALHFAVDVGHSGVVRFLLENDANPFIRDKKKQLPIDMARKSTSEVVIDLINSYCEAKKESVRLDEAIEIDSLGSDKKIQF